MGHSRILSLLALGPFVLAEGSVDTKKPNPEATVTVTAEAAPVEVVETPNPVRIVEAAELERLQARTLAELLAAIQPGAVMGTGGPGAQTSVFLNGTLSRNVVILLDGVRLNDPTDVSPNLGSIGLAGIERVELLLGPSSVLYGSDAIGGVINLVSGGASEPGCHGRAVLRVGTSSQAAASASAGIRGDQGWVAAGGQSSRQGSDFPNDVFRQAGGFLRMGRKIGGLDLTLFYRNSGQTAAIPFDVQYLPPTWDPQRVYVADRETRARQENWGVTARYQATPSLLLENVATVIEGATGDPAGAGRVQKDRSFRRFEDTLGFSWTPTAGLRVSGRLEGREDRSDATNYYDPVLFYAPIRYRGEGRDLAGALEVRWALAEGLDWVSGLRREGSHRDLTRAASGARSRAGQAESSTFKTGLNWVLSPVVRLYGSFGQGFRMPNLVEFSLNAQASVVDAKDYQIAPERSRTLQFGVTGRFQDHFEYRVEAQRTRLSNLLAYRYTYSGAFTDHYENAGIIQAQSVEGALGWRGGKATVWGWDLILRSQETRDLDHNTETQRFGSTDNAAIVRHPFFTASLAAFAQRGPLRADVRYDRIGSRYDIQEVPSFDVITTGRPFEELNLTLSWNVRKDLSFTLRGEHLLQPRQNLQDWLSGARDQDGNAQLVNGYPAPSRRVSLAATYRW